MPPVCMAVFSSPSSPLPPSSWSQHTPHASQFIKNPRYLGRDNTMVNSIQLPCINGLPLLIFKWNFWQNTSVKKGKWL